MITLRQELCTIDTVTPVNAFNEIDGYYYRTTKHTPMEIIKKLFDGYPLPLMVFNRDDREICYASLPSLSGDDFIGQKFDTAVELVGKEVSSEPIAYFNKQWFGIEEKPFSWKGDQYVLVLFKQRTEIPDEKTLASWKNMIAVMLHRFRSPLTGISGYVDMLTENNEDQDQESYFNLVNKGINHLYDMMDELEILYNIDSKNLENNGTSISAEQLFQHLLLNYKDEVQQQIDISSVDPAIEFNGNTSIIKRILEIMVQNGLDHTPEGTVSISVPSEHCIQISNEGPAIPEEIVNTLFHPFVTNKANGLGIGLTMALLYARQIGGTIFLSKNTDTEGITFTLGLPK